MYLPVLFFLVLFSHILVAPHILHCLGTWFVYKNNPIRTVLKNLTNGLIYLDVLTGLSLENEECHLKLKKTMFLPLESFLLTLCHTQHKPSILGPQQT